MSNMLKMELKGKTVILDSGRKFKCQDGFGCYPFTTGNAIFGTYLDTGEKARVEGYEVKELVSEEESR